MISKPNKFFAGIAVLFFMVIQTRVSAQLSNFSLTVTPTNETCTGNGSLQFSVSNTSPGASIFYSVYLLPSTTTPIAVVSTNQLTGLGSGSYLVIATQTLGALSNTKQQTVQITDLRHPLQYQCQAQALNCQIGNITVAVAQGNPVSYQIVNGPVTVPAQASNVFSNIPLGDYLVKVSDACGDALVQACTLAFNFNPGDLVFDANTLISECQLEDCNTKRISFYVHVPYTQTGQPLPGLIIPYPFELTTTVTSNTGATVEVHQTVSSGSSTNQVITVDIPFYAVSSYTIGIKIIDPCGNVLTTSTQPVNISGIKSMDAGIQGPKECLKKITVDSCNTLPPYQISFLSAPAGFNPNDFNSVHPGPFSGQEIVYSSDVQHEIPDGNYVIQLTDACGAVLVDQVDVHNSKTDLILPENGYFDGCDYIFLVQIGYEGIQPQTVMINEAPPTFGHTIPYDASSFIDPDSGVFVMNFNVPGHYVVDGVNVCGRPYHFEFDVPEPNVAFFASGSAQLGCTHTQGAITFSLNNNQSTAGPPIATATLTLVPDLFGQSAPFDISDTILLEPDFPFDKTHAGLITGLPEGDYKIEVVDLCGNHYGPIQVNIPVNISQDPPDVNVLEGCSPGLGSVRIATKLGSNTILTQVMIMSTQSDYNHSFPYDVSFNINPIDGAFYMNSLPDGLYTFYTKDSCGVEHTFEVEIGNHFFNTSVEVQGRCGSFNLFLHDTGTSFTLGTAYLLHRYNSAMNRWEHPFTGFPYNPAIFPNQQNSYLLQENNYNLTAQGHFRVIKVNYVYSNGNTSLVPCVNVLQEFDFIGNLKITDAFKISCSSGSSQVLLVAGDTSPLTYEIIEKDGQPFYVNNQNSNLFTGLAPAIYKFKVTDPCGNIVMRLFDVTVLSEPVITPTGLCDGQQGQLDVQPFSFLSYQWWNADDPTTILSTNSSLHFSPFSLATSVGTYYVRIYSDSPLSCIDITIPYTIDDWSNPKAGNDNEITICARNAFNLESLRSGVFDQYGYWIETTNSGALNGHYWLPSGLAAGTYTFKYVVPGFCDFVDEAIFDITLIESLQAPIITMNHQYCQGDTVVFGVQSQPNITYSWTGPNGFNSSEVSPQIADATNQMNGTYTVKAQAFGCESTASIDLNIGLPPQFSINTLCSNSNQILFASPIDDSYNPEEVNYFWQGPNGFNSHDTQVVLNDLQPGQYSLVITDLDGCNQSKSTDILKTKCLIPSGISPNGDGRNETFDLTGFGVIKFKIFNRYGTIVFEQDDYSDQWHGQDYNDHTLPDGIYFYYLKLQSSEEKTGWVYVTK